MTNKTKQFDNYLTNHLSTFSESAPKSSRSEWIKNNFQKYLPTNKEAKILEIGPGFGELVSFLSQDLGYSNVKAIDISEEVVDFCNSLAPNSTELVEDTTKFLRARPKTFNTIFMLHVLEHIPKSETLNLLSEIYNSLEDNGILIVEVPNMANPIIANYFRYSDFTHEAGFTDVSLKYVLQKTGFADVRVYSTVIPAVSTFRLIQRILQTIANQILSIIIKFYMPSQKQLLSPTIFAVAQKHRQ